MNNNIDSYDNNWRSLLNKKYEQPEYQQILGNETKQNFFSKTGNDLIDSSMKYHGAASSRRWTPSIPLNPAQKPQEEIANLEGAENVDEFLSEGIKDEYDRKKHLFENYDAIRFPPVPKLPLSSALNKEEFKIDETMQANALKRIHSTPELNTIQTSEAIAGIEFLENMLTTFVDKLDEVRKIIVEHGNYVYSLNKPPEDDDFQYVESVILENLKTLYNDLKQLVEDMLIFQEQRVNEMIYQDRDAQIYAASNPDESDPIFLLKNSLILRGMKLNDEITMSLLNVEQLHAYSLALVKYPNFPVSQFEGFHTYWDPIVRLQKKQICSDLQIAMRLYIGAQGGEIEPILYKYCYSPEDHAFYLKWRNVSFSKGQFLLICQFLEYQWKVSVEMELEQQEAIENEKNSVDGVSFSYHYGGKEQERKQQQEQEERTKQSTSSTDGDAMIVNKSSKPFAVSITSDGKFIHEKNMNPASPFFLCAYPVNNSILNHLRMLVLSNSNISDADCYAFSTILPHFLSLFYLDLSKNCITYAGMASLVTTIFEHKLVIEIFKLDSNFLNTDAAILLAQAMDYLPLLKRLSLNNNPIKDAGAYQLLKHCLNKHRRIVSQLPPLEKPTTSPSMSQGGGPKRTGLVGSTIKSSLTGSNPSSPSRLPGGETSHDNIEHDEEDEEEEEEEEEEFVGDESGKQHRSKPRYPSNCYYQDFFTSHLTIELLKQHHLHQIHEENRKNYQWVNTEDEEFQMDIASEYSYHENSDEEYEQFFEKEETKESLEENKKEEVVEEGNEGNENPENSHEQVNERQSNEELIVPENPEQTPPPNDHNNHDDNANKNNNDNKNNRTIQQQTNNKNLMKIDMKKFKQLSYQEMLQQFESTSLAKTLSEKDYTFDALTKNYPKFVKLLLKHRLKIIAISMWKRCAKRGHPSLESISFENCSLTSCILPMLSLTYRENPKLIDLNISRNKYILSRDISCEYLAELIYGSSLRNINLSHTHLNDTGLSIIANAIHKHDHPNEFPSPYPPNHPNRFWHKRKTISYMEFSNNCFGPTGAHIIANLANEFVAERIVVGSTDRTRSAPFPMKAFPWYYDAENEEERKKQWKKFRRSSRSTRSSISGDSRRKGKRGGAGSGSEEDHEGEDLDEDASFADYDLSESDDHYDQDDENYDEDGDYEDHEGHYGEEYEHGEEGEEGGQRHVHYRDDHHGDEDEKAREQEEEDDRANMLGSVDSPGRHTEHKQKKNEKRSKKSKDADQSKAKASSSSLSFLPNFFSRNKKKKDDDSEYTARLEML